MPADVTVMQAESAGHPARLAAATAVRAAVRPTAAPLAAAVAPRGLAAAALAAPLVLTAEPALAGPIDVLQSIQIGPLNGFQLLGFSPPIVAVVWALLLIGPGFIQQFTRLLFPRKEQLNRRDFDDPRDKDRTGDRFLAEQMRNPTQGQ